jgi:hypothetical protein
VIRADDEIDAVAAFERISRMLDTMTGEARTLVVERFVAGAEVAIEGLLVQGHFVPICVFDKPDPLDGPYFEETIYVTPSRHEPAEIAAATEAVGQAAQALGLVEGPIHGEVRLGADGIAVLEVAARTIGGRCASAVRLRSGDLLEQVVLRHWLGLPIGDPTQAAGSSGVMMLPIPHSGTLVGISGQQDALAVEGITALEITIATGRDVVALPEGGRYLGFLFAEGRTSEAVEAALRTAHGRLEFTIDRVSAA